MRENWAANCRSAMISGQKVCCLEPSVRRVLSIAHGDGRWLRLAPRRVQKFNDVVALGLGEWRVRAMA